MLTKPVLIKRDKVKMYTFELLCPHIYANDHILSTSHKKGNAEGNTRILIIRCS